VAFLTQGDADVPAQTRYSILVENIPSRYRSDAALHKYFEGRFGGSVHSAHVFLSLAPLERLSGTRHGVVCALERALAREGGNAARGVQHTPRHRQPWWDPNGPTVDSIPWWTKRLKGMNDEVAEAQRVALAASLLHEQESSRDLLSTSGIAAALGVANPLDAAAEAFKRTRSGSGVLLVAGDLAGLPASPGGLLAPLPATVAEEHDGEGRHDGLSPRALDMCRTLSSPSAQSDRSSHGSESSERVRETWVGGVDARAEQDAQAYVDLQAALSACMTGECCGNARKAFRAFVKAVKLALFAVASFLCGVTSAVKLITVGGGKSTTGIVTFTSAVACADAQQVVLTHRPMTMQASPAPEPRNIIWRNIGVTTQQLYVATPLLLLLRRLVLLLLRPPATTDTTATTATPTTTN